MGALPFLGRGGIGPRLSRCPLCLHKLTCPPRGGVTRNPADFTAAALWRGTAQATVTFNPGCRQPIRARVVSKPKISTSAKVKMEGERDAGERERCGAGERLGARRRRRRQGGQCRTVSALRGPSILLRDLLHRCNSCSGNGNATPPAGSTPGASATTFPVCPLISCRRGMQQCGSHFECKTGMCLAFLFSFCFPPFFLLHRCDRYQLEPG